jgi:shikimate kinase
MGAMNLFLIGYRGCGKTTVAAELSKLLGWPWLDADVELERQAGQTIKQIFADQGETAFRDLESQIAKELAMRERHIIALGGGAVLREQNRQLLIGRGKTIWLKAEPEVLQARIQADATTAERRPNLTGQGGLSEIRTLLAARTPLYASCADVTIDSQAGSPAEIARQIVAELRLSE